MLRALTRNKRFLLTGVLIHRAGSEADKLKTTNGKSVPDRPEEFANVDSDKISGSTRNIEEEGSNYGHTRNAEISGWDRVKMAVCTNEAEGLSPQMHFTIYMAGCGSVGGFLFGGLRDYAKAVNLFLYTNDTSKFFNASGAKRALARDSFKAFMKGGVFTAPKFGVLCGIFGLANTVVSSYYGENGIFAISLAGAFTTAVMKWNLGIRGMISGFVTGGLTGLLMGTVVSNFLSVTGNSISDIQNFIYNTHIMRETIISENLKSGAMSEIEKYYNEKAQGLPVGFPDK